MEPLLVDVVVLRARSCLRDTARAWDCARVQVLDYGNTISIGTAAEVQRDPAVITACLGARRGAVAPRPAPSAGA